MGCSTGRQGRGEWGRKAGIRGVTQKGKGVGAV